MLIDLHTTEPSAGRKRAAGRPVLEHPLATEWLTLRAATCNDADPTWKFRQLDAVNEWLTGSPADLDGYHELFTEPARLATTVIVWLGHDPAGPVIGDFMLRRGDALGSARDDGPGQKGPGRARLGPRSRPQQPRVRN